MKDNFQWLDTQELNRRKDVIQEMVATMQQSGMKWRSEWLVNLGAWTREDYYKQVFNEVCEEFGYKDLNNDMAIIARAETHKRLHGLQEFFDNRGSRTGWQGWRFHNNNFIKLHINELIEVDDNGTPSLKTGWEKRLEKLCTHEIPQEYRALYAIFMKHQETLAKLNEELKKLPYEIYFRDWGKLLGSGEFTAEMFGKWLKVRL